VHSYDDSGQVNKTNKKKSTSSSENYTSRQLIGRGLTFQKTRFGLLKTGYITLWTTVDYARVNLVCIPLFLGDGYLSVIDVLLKVMGRLSVNGAANGEGSAKALLHSSLEVPSHRFATHGTGNTDDGIKRDVTTMYDILDLLPVSRRLLKLLQDHGSGSRDNRRSGHTVNNTELHHNLDTLPLHSSLLDIFSDLLRGLLSKENSNIKNKFLSVEDIKIDGAHNHTDRFLVIYYKKYSLCEK